MKAKYIVLFFLLFAGFVNVSGQDTLLMEVVGADAIPEFNPEVSLNEKEALIIIRSVCPFTFKSNVDKDENIVIVDTKQQDYLYYYAVKLSVPSRARRLRMISVEYEAITNQLGDLQPEEIRRFNVTDPFINPFRKLLKEGMGFFGQGNYEQAKGKFVEALGLAIDSQEKEETTALAEKATLCIEAKAKAERYYNNRQWFEASREYDKVIGATEKKDTYCLEKYEQCMNGDRKITGIVTNRQGQPLSGVSIVFEEQVIDKKGKTKYSWSKKVVKTNTTGRFEVDAWMKTRKLQYWLFSYRKAEIGIPGDTNEINLVVNDGSGENPLDGLFEDSDNSGNSK